MNCEDDRTVVVLHQVDEAFDDVEGVEGIEATGRFVKEEYTRACDEFASNTNTAFLTTRYTTAITTLV